MVDEKILQGLMLCRWLLESLPTDDAYTQSIILGKGRGQSTARSQTVYETHTTYSTWQLIQAQS